VDLGRVRTVMAGRGRGAPPPFTVEGSRAAAVLVPLFEDAGRLRLLLTRRSSDLTAHRGEVAFPGGRQDPGEDLLAAALREAREEIGLAPEHVRVLGELDRLATVATRFVVAPFVGELDGRPATRPNPAEIARVFDVPVTELLDDGVYREEVWELPVGPREVSF